MTLRTLAAACGAAFLAHAFIAPAAFAADAPGHWVSAWGTALQPIPQLQNPPPLYRAPDVAGRTVRQIVYPTLSGNGVRLRVSNQYGKAPLVIDDLRIARSAGGAATQSAGEARVTFGGKGEVSIPAGAELESDPVSIEIQSGAPYAISSYMGREQRLVAWHRVANQLNYVSTPGNHADDPTGKAFAARFTQYAWVTSLSVNAPGSEGIAAIGDSITDGMRSSLNQNRRWPDGLARELEHSGRKAGVVNLGISGNRLLSDSACYGDALDRRFEHDVMGQAGIKAVVLLIGINDINFAAMPPHAGLDCDAPHTVVSAADLIAGYQRVIATAHRHGIRIVGATVTPAALPESREKLRTAVNQWIRTSHAFDGVVDFDAALRDPAAEDRLQRGYDSGDHIHPNDAGYAVMARTVDSAVLLRASTSK
ncbi:SGNH/GDSL hydrolase family protein [Paraburkholderia sp.]|uniref:SGNH/GDSL hydrolase family protein n=1 Tax=Paraburkholderia sp. TaxID=1926495 RepID=UPI00238E62B4|nr:SGNH/GDSL hydrolase family protein [Paraburkholderia sp.]MDE1181131.1 SGNH/GDSL hydrolase family protein [Paraburkholderia sp.]